MHPRQPDGLLRVQPSRLSASVDYLQESGWRSSVIGLTIGGLGALLLTSLMSTLLFGVTSTDVVSYAALAGLLIFVALLACSLPAGAPRRSIR